MEYCYQYPRPALTVDAIILKEEKDKRYVLLVERKYDPYANLWALPGGFMEDDETAEEAIVREIKEETCLNGLSYHQLFTVTTLKRDPRGRTVSVIYFGQQGDQLLNPKAADDAKDINWFDIDDLPELAFDHLEVIQKGIAKIDADKF